MPMEFWRDKTVLVTGHTGFKGGWLSLWLKKMGAKVIGFALLPGSEPNLCRTAKIAESIDQHIIGDIRDLIHLQKIFQGVQPQIVFHLAAQPLVQYSYQAPVETYAVNVMGTVNVLEAARQCENVNVFINVTSDKCYENKEWVWGYRETEPFGGHDPYSNSKACSELVTSAYKHSFYSSCKKALASGRAGNVIGGGDWAENRLIPDIIRAFMAYKPAKIRNPYAVRPWQHVLEPLAGYLLLAEKLWENPVRFSEGWNFGPYEKDILSVQAIANQMVQQWGENASWINQETASVFSSFGHEAQLLKLDISKAVSYLRWQPRLNLTQALKYTVDWYKAFHQQDDMHAFTLAQIQQFIQEK